MKSLRIISSSSSSSSSTTCAIAPFAHNVYIVTSRSFSSATSTASNSADKPRTRTATGKLTTEQVAKFYRDGYLVIEHFASMKEIRDLKQSAHRMLDAFANSEEVKQRSIFTTKEQERSSDDYFLGSGDKIRCFWEKDAFDANGQLKTSVHSSINKIGHALHELDPVFWRFSNSKRVKNICDSLQFSVPRLPQSMYIFKQPRIGGAVSPHQDSTFLYTNPLSTVGMWFAFEDANVQNGCLWAVPGSHKQGVRRRFLRNPNGNGTIFQPAEEVDFDVSAAVSLPVSKGTVILLDGSLVHFSYENESAESRHAYTLHIVEGAYDYPSDNWLQREDKKEFMLVTGDAKGDHIVIKR